MRAGLPALRVSAVIVLYAYITRGICWGIGEMAKLVRSFSIFASMYLSEDAHIAVKSDQASSMTIIATEAKSCACSDEARLPYAGECQ